MKNFKNYIGKRVKIQNKYGEEEKVKIKKFLGAGNNVLEAGNPSYWTCWGRFETEDGRKIILYYSPYGYLAVGRRGQMIKKVWEFEDD
jgi:hypothetical protein